jgi:rhomboid family GlyGly-CTERM serine protease
LLTIFNLPLLFGGGWRAMMFHSLAVIRGGEWWRLLTHPFVHVTWYHLLLDGTAFLTLYYGLFEKSFLRRFAYVVAGAAGSLACSWACAANSAQGLCGLSGIAHGLMAVSAVEMIVSPSSDRATRRVGWCSFILVVVKAGFEALTGRMFFAFLDFGMLGDPVAVSHAGGVIGGLAMMLILRYRSAAFMPLHREIS